MSLAEISEGVTREEGELNNREAICRWCGQRNVAEGREASALCLVLCVYELGKVTAACLCPQLQACISDSCACIIFTLLEPKNG